MSTLLAREQLIKNAALALNLVWGQLRLLNTQNLHDAAIMSENFFAVFLNRVQGGSLKNLNDGNSNYPGIDLGDKQNGVCYQVTAENTSSKLAHTIKQYVNNGYAQDYPQLRMLIIGEKYARGYPKLIVPSGVNFSSDKDVIDIRDLTKSLSGLATPTLQLLSADLETEMPILRSPQFHLPQTDVEALQIMRDLFDRPAFHDDWRVERNFQEFEARMTDLIGLLASGQWEGVKKTKARFEFKDAWQQMLKNVYKRLLEILQLYTTHRLTGEIDPRSNSCHFRDPTTNDRFNDAKNAVVNEMNKVLTVAGIPLIEGVYPLSGGQ